MSYLAGLLDDPKRLLRRIKAGAVEPKALRSAVAALGGGDSGPALPFEDVTALQGRVIAMARSHQAGRISRQDLRQACIVFLQPPTPPGRMPDVAAALVEELKSRKKRAFALGLFNAYLDNFKAEDPDIARLALQLNDLAETVDRSRPMAWAARAKRFELFRPGAAPKALAKAVAMSSEAPDVVLADAGLGTAVRARGRLVEEAFRAACRACASLSPVEAPHMQRRLLQWGHDAGGRFAFPDSLPHLCEAFLNPWSAVEPEKSHQSHLIQILERAGGGDPRTQPARWRPVQQQAPDAYAILLRWLTRASVMQFLDIVGRSMTDSDSRRMWAYRRAFWTSYLLGQDGAPAIQKAWIAFGKNAAQLARDAARSSGDESFASFGLQNDKSDMHSALIMEIGDLLIVDWSHNAKYNVWRFRDPGRPKLFEPSYPRGTLYNAPITDSHIAPGNYAWQRRLAKIIEGKTFYAEKPSWRPKGV